MSARDLDFRQSPYVYCAPSVATDRITAPSSILYDTGSQALDVVSKMLAYDPLKRIKPLEVCSHGFVDEVRGGHGPMFQTGSEKEMYP